MTQEEYERELEKLRAENQYLRNVIGRKPKREAIPEHILAKCINLLSVCGEEHWSRKKRIISISPECSSMLSKLIRMTVFAYTQKMRGNKRIYAAVMELSEDEYDLYVETLDRMLSALDDGVAKGKDVNANAEAEAEEAGYGSA